MDKISDLMNTSLVDFAAYLRAQKKNYLLFFQKEYYDCVIAAVTVYSQRIYVLDDFIYDQKDFPKVKTIDTGNYNLQELDQVIHRIFTENEVACDEITNGEHCYALLFTVCSLSDYFTRFYEFKMLGSILPKKFFQKKLYLTDDQVIIRFSNQTERAEFKKNIKPNALFLSVGVGDFLIIYDILVPFIKEQRDLYIFLNRYYSTKKYDNIHMMLNMFGVNAKIIVLEYPYFNYIYDYATHAGTFDRCYLMDVFEENFNGIYMPKFQREYLHYHDFASRVLCYQKPDRELRKVWEKIDDLISKDAKQKIDKILQGGKINVGLQICSSNDEFSQRGRHWQKSEVYRLCELARNEYQLINLTPYWNGYYDDCEFVDASSFSLLEMCYLISKLDLLVGIDSTCGHIAAIYDVPSITLWTKDYPAECRQTKISWRVYKLNYSIVPITKMIDADLVFRTMQKIFSRDIVLQEKIDLTDTLRGDNIIYI